MFDSDFLAKLEYLSLLSRRAFRGQLLAQRRTKQAGGGIEFSDHREYIQGDDLRYLDWNVYARHGDRLLKRFVEEEDLHVYVLLDCSHSMNADAKDDFGKVNKFAFARQITAALSYIALADLDRISIIAYDSKIRTTLPLMRGKNNALSMLRFLESLSTSGESTNLAEVATTFVQRAPRTGLALIVSDLYDQDGFRRGVDVLRHRRFEPHVIQVHSPSEADPGLLGDVELRDVETGRRVNVTVTQKKLKQYRELFQAFLEEVQDYCRLYGLSHTRATSNVPFDDVLMTMMRTAGALA
ncbi:MAG: DUF58 domain-containing protein [Planctomycetota bacterium]